MYTVIIVDDEKHCQDHLANLLKYYNNYLQIVATCNSVQEGITAIQKLKPDLLLLDIEIGHNTGFELLKAIKSPNISVIFTTGYDKFAVRAFKFSAIDYLLKPINSDEFDQAIQRFLSQQNENKRLSQIETLLTNLAQPKSIPNKLVLPTSTGLIFVSINDIIRCQADVNYTTLFIQGAKKIVVSKPLKEYDDILADHNFFRIHQSHLINLAHIKSYQKGKGGTVIMADDSEVEVSTRRKEAFISAINNL
jgi:two-component system LytT family response regulator